MNKLITKVILWLQQLILLWGILLLLLLLVKFLPISFNLGINYSLAISCLLYLMISLYILELIVHPKSFKESYIEIKDKYLNYFKQVFSKESATAIIKASKIVEIYQKKIVRVVILPILLLLFGIGYGLTIAMQADRAITLLTIPGERSYFSSEITQPIELKWPIHGEFRAKQNNLGMISIKIEGSQPASTRIALRVKQKGEQEWWAEDQRHLDQLSKDDYLYFGFTPMPTSAKQQIEFELELVEYTEPIVISEITDEAKEDQSETEEPEDILAEQEANEFILDELDSIEPLKITNSNSSIQTHYKYDKQELINNPQSAVKYIFTKTTQIVSRNSFYLSALVGFVPLFFYLSLLQFSSWFKKEFKTKEDYLSLGLIIYLSLEIYAQLLRLGEAYLADVVKYCAVSNHSVFFTLVMLAFCVLERDRKEIQR